VSQLIEKLEEDADDIKKSSIKLSWFMRGGATYEDILNMSSMERTAIVDLIEENLETTKKSGMNFF
jgi:hypothetical protein